MAPEKTASMVYFTRYKFLNDNSVTIVIYFKYCAEVCFREVILVSGPLSNVRYYAITKIRVDFQVCGSPHFQSFWCFINEPVTDEDPTLYVQHCIFRFSHISYLAISG